MVSHIFMNKTHTLVPIDSHKVEKEQSIQIDKKCMKYRK
jgi:hypothetical protein